jgi:hypothetical protein
VKISAKGCVNTRPLKRILRDVDISVGNMSDLLTKRKKISRLHRPTIKNHWLHRRKQSLRNVVDVIKVMNKFKRRTDFM